MTADRAWERARQWVGKPAIGYHLGAGGVDPYLSTPASAHWKSGIVGCDCSGYQAYAWGMPRRLPEKVFPVWGGYIACDSVIADARGDRLIFEPIVVPEIGALIVYPGVDFDHDGDRDLIGHIGMIVPPLPIQWDRKSPRFADLQVIHCGYHNWRLAPSELRLERMRAPAVLQTSGVIWDGKDSRRYRGETLRDPRWASIMVRVKPLAG